MENPEASFRDPKVDAHLAKVDTITLMRIAIAQAVYQDSYPGGFIALVERGNEEVFEVAKKHLQSRGIEERTLAATLLGRLGDTSVRDNVGYIGTKPGKKYFPQAFDLLVDCVKREKEPNVLAAIATAFGHIKDERAIPYLLKLKNHPDEAVRFGVVYGLGGFEDESAIQALIELSQDSDDEVRNWATFSLATQIEADTDEVRMALFRNLDDPDFDTRFEALGGLAKRRVREIIPRMLDEFANSVGEVLSHVVVEVCDMLIELKDEIGDPRITQILEDYDYL